MSEDVPAEIRAIAARAHISHAELARRIKESDPSPPVLLITGYTGISDDAINLPRLAKPFGQAEIAAALSSVLVQDEKVVRFPARI